MPSLTSPLARLPEAISQAAVVAEQHAKDHQVVIGTLLEMTEDLLSFTKQNTLLGKGDPNPDLYTPSLGSLYARLEAGQIPPSPAAVGASPKKRLKVHKRTGKSPSQRSLQEYEDIYYALLALIQEMHWDILTRINNGFNHIDDFVCDGSVRIFQLLDYLVKSWEFLNDSSVAKALDNAIREACYKTTQKKFKDDFKQGKYLIADYKSLLKALKKDYDEIPGLVWIGGWSPAMINASLQQKWRPVYSAERMDKVRKGALKKAEQTEKRVSAERKAREELLKAKLWEETFQRQAQLEQEELHLQTEQEQEQAEESKAARADLVSTYMENLRSQASPHARRLVHGTSYDLSPIPFAGLQTPAGYTSSNSQLEFPESASVQGTFFVSSPSHDGHGASMAFDMQKGYYGGGSAQNSAFGPDQQHGFDGGSTLTEHERYISPNAQLAFCSPVPQHGYCSPITQHGYTSPTAPHGSTSPDAPHNYVIPNDHHSHYETELSPTNHVDPGTQQGFFNGEHVHDDPTNQQRQQALHEIDPFQAKHTQNYVQNNVPWGMSEPENHVGGNMRPNTHLEGHAPERQPEFETQPGCQNQGDTPDTFPGCRHGVYGVAHPQDASAYLSQQGFDMQGLLQGSGQVHERGESNGDGDADADVDMDDDCF